jgi:predicted nucleotidyltransferase
MRLGTLIGVYVFGSVGRGEQDDRSDLDLLAVVKNRTGQVAEKEVLRYVPPVWKNLKSSISWYGDERMKTMFGNGELFAWHLHRETIPLYDPSHFLKNLGRPSEYKDGMEDIASFQNILRGIPVQMR